MTKGRDVTDLKDDEEPEGLDSSSEPSSEDAGEDSAEEKSAEDKSTGKAGTSGKGKSTATRAKIANKKARSRGGLGLFLREVIAELRKVVRPTRQELWTYTTVVIVFVLVIMVLVSALDFGIAKLLGWAFGGA
jgi:preprotein translocase subunit SecE